MSQAKYHEQRAKNNFRTGNPYQRAVVLLITVILLVNANILLSQAQQGHVSPTVIVSPGVQTGFDGQQIAYTVTVVNNDPAGSPSSIFSVMGEFPEPGFVHTPVCVRMVVPAGASRSRTVIIRSPVGTCSGPKRFREVARNESYSRVLGFGEAIFNVETLGPNCGLGTCMPVGVGHKPKQDLETKLRTLVANDPVPSAFGAAFYRIARRFLSGSAPANSFERSAFAIFAQLSPDVLNVMACAVRNFDRLPTAERYRLFSPEITAGGDRPVSPDELIEAVANEILQRASQAVFGHSNDAFVERPGLPRPLILPTTTGALISFQPVICEINGISVNDSPPRLTQGDSVVLKGINFLDAAATVVLKQRGSVIETMQASVVGDSKTPLEETVGGITRPIADCRVKDIIMFTLPDRMLPSGDYQIQVIVPNVMGGTPSEVTSEEVTINLDVSPSVNFQVRTESLGEPFDETNVNLPGAERLSGSDEAALKFIVVAEGRDGTLSQPQEFDFRANGVDTGDAPIAMPLGLFSGSDFKTLAICLVGFEVDSESAFKSQIQGFFDAFVAILTANWELIKKGYELAKDKLESFGVPPSLAAAMAVVVVTAMVVSTALWAPADRIIEDVIVLSAVDLETLTSPLKPIPDETTHDSPHGIEVTIRRGERDGSQFRHRREYHSGSERSTYGVKFLYSTP